MFEYGCKIEKNVILQFGADDRICRPCLQRAERHNQQENRELPEANPVLNIEEPSLDRNVPREANQNTQTSPFYIEIAGYSRAAINAQLCIVRDCNNQNDLHRINNTIRQSILLRHNFYIPRGCRVCNEHLLSNMLHDISENCRNVYRTFSPVQITDMLNLQKKSRCTFLDFEKYREIDNDVFHFYIGFSKNNFQSVLENTPTF